MILVMIIIIYLWNFEWHNVKFLGQSLYLISFYAKIYLCVYQKFPFSN